MYQQNNQNTQNNKQRAVSYNKPDLDLELYFHSIDGQCSIGQHNGSIVTVYKMKPSFQGSQREETYFRIFVSDKYVTTEALQKIKLGSLISIKGKIVADFAQYTQQGLYPVFVMSVKTFWGDLNFGKDQNVARFGAIPGGQKQQPYMQPQAPQTGGYAPQSQSYPPQSQPAPQAQIMTSYPPQQPAPNGYNPNPYNAQQPAQQPAEPIF